MRRYLDQLRKAVYLKRAAKFVGSTDLLIPLSFLSPAGQLFKRVFPKISEVDQHPLKPQKWALLPTPLYDKHLQAQLYSFKVWSSANINRHSLILITGPQSVGKSTLIDRNLETFSKAEVDSLVVNIHLDLIPGLPRFQTMLFHIESQMLNSIVEAAHSWEQKYKKPLITEKTVLRLLDRFHALNLIDMEIAKLLRRLISNTHSHFVSLPENGKEELEALLMATQSRKYGEVFLLDAQLQRLLKLWTSSQSSTQKLRVLLQIILDVLAEREGAKKPQKYSRSVYRTGLSTLPFLLDILNQIAGYDSLFHLPRQEQSYTEEDLHRNEQILAKQLYEAQMEDLKTNRIPHISKDPHVVVAIHGCDDLWYLEGCEERGRALLEWLFLRLYNPVGYRKHFPILLQFSKPQFYFVHHIPHFAYAFEYSFPMLEVFRPQFQDLEKQLAQVLPSHNLAEVQTVLGHNAFFYHALYEDLASLYEQQKEGLVLKDNGHFKKSLVDLIDYLPTLRKIRTQYYHRVVNFTTHPLLGEQLDAGTARWQALYFLRAFSKRPNTVMISATKRQMHWLEQPFLAAANEQGLCFSSRYFCNWKMEETFHQFIAYDYFLSKRTAMSWRERLGFFYYKKMTMFNFGKMLDGVRKQRRYEGSEVENEFHSETYEFSEIYYGADSSLDELNQPITIY